MEAYIELEKDVESYLERKGIEDHEFMLELEPEFYDDHIELDCVFRSRKNGYTERNSYRIDPRFSEKDEFIPELDTLRVYEVWVSELEKDHSDWELI